MDNNYEEILAAFETSQKSINWISQRLKNLKNSLEKNGATKKNINELKLLKGKLNSEQKTIERL